jgi:hypothetical protein
MPEIIPGHVEKRSMLSSNLISTYFANWGLEKHQTSLQRNRYLDLVFRSIIVVGSLWISILAFGPAYLYRLSIKSTAWVHWPLAYIARPLRFADDPEEVRIRLWRDPREWLRRLAMIITLTGALVATIPSLSTIKGTFPGGVVSIFEYAVLIDVKSLLINPWRVVALVGAVITLILTWYGCELSLLVSRSAARADRMARAATWAGFLEYAMRVRDICGWVFWTLVVVHAALWLSPSTVWLDGYPREVLKFIYGSYLPPALQ